MGFIRTLLISCLMLMSGCAVVPMIAAIPSAIVEPIFGQFGSEERSLPVSMRNTLVATQRGLLDMKLTVDVLEIDEDGYNITFGNETLSGEIELRQQTEKLTTIEVQVKTRTRKESVEEAVLDQIEGDKKKVRKRDRFNFKDYHYLRQKADLKSRKLGWYRPGAQLSVKKVHKHPQWLRLKLPSGHYAFLKGSVKKE